MTPSSFGFVPFRSHDGTIPLTKQLKPPHDAAMNSQISGFFNIGMRSGIVQDNITGQRACPKDHRSVGPGMSTGYVTPSQIQTFLCEPDAPFAFLFRIWFFPQRSPCL
jgi:hypothetical protein